MDNGFPAAPVFGVASNGVLHDTKTEIIKTLELDYFVDDYIRHFNDINVNTNCRCFLWNTPWTEWEQAKPKLNSFKELKILLTNQNL